MDMVELEQSGGMRLVKAEIDELQSSLKVPAELVRALTTWPLVGGRLVIQANNDQSGAGVEMRWMSVSQIIEEATQDQLGIVALRSGYFPIGLCLEGTGDLYFYRNKDGAMVRVSSDALHGEYLDEEHIDVVVESIDQVVARGFESSALPK